MLDKMQYIANDATRNQWESWGNYRSLLIAFIDTQIKKLRCKPKRILILGAGNGNDLPVQYLEEIAREIVLVDIDPKALNFFLTGSRNAHKYSTFILDLSGLVGQLKDKSYTWPAAEKIKYITGLNPKPDLGTIPGTFDMVINCNYTTQLVAPYFLWKTEKDPGLAELTLAVEKLTGRIMREIFRQIYQKLNPGGGLVHLTDFLELRWNKVNGQVSPAITKVCGSELAENKGLFSLKDMKALQWDFFKNQEEEIIFIVLSYYLSKLKK